MLCKGIVVGIFRGNRYFSKSSLSSFDWVHRDKSWEVTYTIVAPDSVENSKTTLVLFPSTSLLSSREEWRGAAELLSDAGYTSILVDWPGWHQRSMPLNWCIEDDVDQKRLVSTFTSFAYSALKHADSFGGPVHAVCVGGSAAVHVHRALQELHSADNVLLDCSLTCFSPTWRNYLTRTVADGYPQKLARRKWVADWLLSNMFVRSKMAFRIYKSKFGLCKLTRRHYDEKLQMNTNLLESKREVICRDRPLSIDAAMMAGHFDPINTGKELADELFGKEETGETAEDDDEDDALLGLQIPHWVKQTTLVSANTRKPTRLHFVIPQDCDSTDLLEMKNITQCAPQDAKISEIHGRLFAHEEYPALAATLIDSYANP